MLYSLNFRLTVGVEFRFALPNLMGVSLSVFSGLVSSYLFLQKPVLAEVTAEVTAEISSLVTTTETIATPTPAIASTPSTINLDPVIDPPSPKPSWQNSPVLQRWQRQIPNVLEDIENDPSFRTRWRLGYGENNQQQQVTLGVEDIFLGERLTLSGDYQTGNLSNYGAELRYYMLPLGNYVNAAPVLGYRQINSPDLTTSGISVGGRLQVILSRPSAADLALSQTWVAPGSSQEVAITNLALGYAITSNLRVGTQWQLESRGGKSDRRWGFFLELY